MGLALLAVTALALGSPPLSGEGVAADVVPPNRGFESELSGWTRFGAAGVVTATTERAFEGARSAKLVDSSGTTSTGLESGRLGAAAGKYAAVARVFVASGSASLYLRFYNSAGTLVGNHSRNTGGPTGGSWATLSVDGTAPAGTTKVSVLIYSAGANIGTSYFDDVSITKGLTNLGVQINNSMINATTFGLGANQNKVFGVFTGSNAANPPRLATIDVDTERVVGTPAPLAGATGAWGATTATDGSVYVGSYSNGTVYRHVPGSGTVTSLGAPIPGETFVWCLTAGTDGRIYGGTYKSAGYFKYEPGSGFATLGSTPIWPGKEYVRSIAFDESQGATYLGVGTNAALIRYDRVTGAKQDVLPARYAGNTMVGGLQFTGGRLFAVMASGSLTVLNIVKNGDGSVTPVEEASGLLQSPHISPARDGKVYLISGGMLQSYDIAARAFDSTGVDFDLTPTKLGWVRLADQVTFPGETLVMVGTYLGRTHLFKYNPASGATRTAVVAGAPVNATDLQTVGAGPDGRVYTGGYLTGGTGVYHPLHGDTNDATPELVQRGLTQTDSILGYQGKTYFGTYSSARVYEYDSALPWDASNPRLMATLGTQGQDRPFAMAAGGGKLFVGTVPKYGAYDGALSVLDLATGETTVKRNLVADQGVIALAYLGGKVYGGTTIRGGLGVDTQPRAAEAKFFAYDPVTGAKTEYPLVLPGGRKPTAVTALAAVDGRIWGLAEGFLFVFDPAAGRFSTAPVQKFSVDYRPYGSWRDAAMAVTPKDTTSVYVTIGNALYRISKANLAVTQIASGAKGIAVDQLGDVYYYNDVNLYRFVP